MTRHRQEYHRPGSHHGFYSPTTLRMAANAAALARVNATRIPCETCGLLILPGAMAVHIDIVHKGDD